MQASARDQAGGGTEPGASAAAERKRRGDMEFENQLAMALQVLIAHLRCCSLCCLTALPGLSNAVACSRFSGYEPYCPWHHVSQEVLGHRSAGCLCIISTL